MHNARPSLGGISASAAGELEGRLVIEVGIGARLERRVFASFQELAVGRAAREWSALARAVDEQGVGVLLQLVYELAPRDCVHLRLGGAAFDLNGGKRVATRITADLLEIEWLLDCRSHTAIGYTVAAGSSLQLRLH